MISYQEKNPKAEKDTFHQLSQIEGNKTDTARTKNQASRHRL